MGDLGYVVGGKFDRDGGFVAVVAQVDGELGDLEQASEQRFGCVGEVESQVGQ
ncbi:hypothetical protein AB0H34_00920 [Saccharopolyspora shandongensis]|uniref:hypothetical protein n=1 Tax=Saccharopolyspora shandongensis TaxID=418495 RepID=UPI0033EDCD01